MQDKIKNIIVAISFIIILLVIFLINIISNDKLMSTSERRKLAQIPDFTIGSILNGTAMEKWEEYVTDQFVGRDFFRGIKAYFSINILKQKDNNNLFEKDGAIYKMEYPLNKNNIEKSVNKMNEVYNKYLKDMNVYYAIIPDKNYYLRNDDHLKFEYNELQQIMKKNLTDFKYIDILNSLKLDDYYKTDLHWKQENLRKVVRKIQNEMELEDTSNTKYIIKDMGEFYGAYYGQLSTNVQPDRLYVLTNENIENAITYNIEKNKNGKIYEESTTSDKYDIYLSGATPIISIENSTANNKKELLLFRDSFGSSIAPLLIENYSKITLIDLRYISSNLLQNYINFEEQDVLFLYSTLVLNQNVLK